MKLFFFKAFALGLLLVSFVVVFVANPFTAPKAHAATLTFTSCPTGTTLHTLVASAFPGDTIQFRISGSPCTIDLSGAGGGTLVVDKNLALDASGSPQPVILSGGNAVVVLQVSAGVTFALNTLTIARGNGGFFSSGLLSDGTVTIRKSTFANNAAISGGGIENRGVMTISESTFANNAAVNGDGGGIESRGTMIISNSTFANNSAEFGGGGVRNFAGGTMTIRNSTFSNDAANFGGGIENDGTVTLSNSTIANNTSANFVDGGIENAGTFNIAQSIVANNRTLNGVPSNCGLTRPLTDQGYNLESGTDCGFTAPTDQQNTDPLFQGGLQNNGGPTQTIALQPGSPAVNKIPINTGQGCVPGGTDQRGFPRPDAVLLLFQETTCDIGAYEVQGELLI